MHKEPQEAEIITQPEGFDYKERYEYYATTTKKVSPFAWIVSILALFFSLIPFFGVVFAIFALIVALVKKVPIILSLFALFIACAVTSFVLFIVWIISLIL